MLHYSKRLVPVPPTHERIGAGLGHPFSDLIFAKWGFNNVANCHHTYPKPDSVRYSLAYSHNSYSYPYILLVPE